jgi:hypothetical protein
MTQEPWSEVVRLSELPVRRRLAPDESTRRRIAETLDLDDLPELEAEVEAAPWLDGARIEGRWRARVVQTCGVSLEPFDSALEGTFSVRAVPEGSPAAPAETAHELDLELASEDPPDVLPAPQVDLAAYVVEHLALEIDPYPRKPGVAFEPPPAERESSPFDVLSRLKPRE